MIFILCIFFFWFILRGACSVKLSPRLVKERQFLLPFCNACWQWLDRIRGTINTPCPNDKHTGIVSVIFRDSKKVYATHSEKIVSVFLSHDWIQTGRDWDRKGEQLSEKPRSIRTSARYSIETSWTFRLLIFEKRIKVFYTVTVGYIEFNERLLKQNPVFGSGARTLWSRGSGYGSHHRPNFLTMTGRTISLTITKVTRTVLTCGPVWTTLGTIPIVTKEWTSSVKNRKNS